MCLYPYIFICIYITMDIYIHTCICKSFWLDIFYFLEHKLKQLGYQHQWKSFFKILLFLTFDFCQAIGQIQDSECALLSVMYLEHKSCCLEMISHHPLSRLTEFTSDCYHISHNPWRAGRGFLSSTTHSFAYFPLASVPPLVVKRIKWVSIVKVFSSVPGPQHMFSKG